MFNAFKVTLVLTIVEIVFASIPAQEIKQFIVSTKKFSSFNDILWYYSIVSGLVVRPGSDRIGEGHSSLLLSNEKFKRFCR